MPANEPPWVRNPARFLLGRKFPFMLDPVQFAKASMEDQGRGRAYEGELKGMSEKQLRDAALHARAEDNQKHRDALAAAKARVASGPLGTGNPKCPHNRPEALLRAVQHWATLSTWTLDEGVALLLGREPRKVNWENVKIYRDIDAFAARYEEVREHALRAHVAKELYLKSTPAEWVLFAERRGWDMPPDLKAVIVSRAELIGEQPTTIPSNGGLDEQGEVQQLQTRVASRMDEAKGQPANEELNGKERKSVYTIIAAMAFRHYPMDLRDGARNDGTAKLLAAVKKAGLSLGKDAAHKHLTAALSLLSEENQRTMYKRAVADAAEDETSE
jgi:hypothetical protein